MSDAEKFLAELQRAVECSAGVELWLDREIWQDEAAKGTPFVEWVRERLTGAL